MFLLFRGKARSRRSGMSESASATPAAGNSAALDALSVVATIVTVGMFLSNSVPLRAVWATRQWGSQRPSGIYGVLLGTTWWSAYGLIIAQPAVIFCNVFGFVVGAFGAVTFAKFGQTPLDTAWVIRTAAAIVGGTLVSIAAIRSGFLVQAPPIQREVLGLCAALSSVLMFGAPLAGAAEIIRLKDASRLSPLVLGMSLAVCLLWTLFGVMLGDPMIAVPNGGGAVVTLMQCALLCWYPRHATAGASSDDEGATEDGGTAMERRELVNPS
jgi:uncharacterized protein with PQ loop repeat